MKTIVRASRIIVTVMNSPGLRQSEIAKVTGYSRVEAHRFCKTLVDVGWLSVVNGKYYEGELFLKYVKRGL